MSLGMSLGLPAGAAHRLTLLLWPWTPVITQEIFFTSSAQERADLTLISTGRLGQGLRQIVFVTLQSQRVAPVSVIRQVTKQRQGDTRGLSWCCGAYGRFSFPGVALRCISLYRWNYLHAKILWGVILSVAEKTEPGNRGDRARKTELMDSRPHCCMDWQQNWAEGPADITFGPIYCKSELLLTSKVRKSVSFPLDYYRCYF